MLELISKYIIIFGLSTFKYMFTPYMGAKAGFTFWENHIVTFLGAFASCVIFYWSANFFMQRAKKKRVIKDALRIEQGKQLKKKFTRKNKIVVKIKNGLGLFGLGIFAPIFLSIPIGSIILAKFFGKKKFTFWYILLVLYIYSFVSCLIFDAIITD